MLDEKLGQSAAAINTRMSSSAEAVMGKSDALENGPRLAMGAGQRICSDEPEIASTRACPAVPCIGRCLRRKSPESQRCGDA